MDDIRVDPVLGTRIHVVGTRQARPNLPSTGCPFCVGGLEAPEPYEVFAFKNRWPAMRPDRCEVVLYTPQHDATIWQLGAEGVGKVVDLWAQRTCQLGARPDVDYVLVFENRGAEVGATIAHPHGQIYAYDHVPERPNTLLGAPWRPDDTADRLVAHHDGFTAVVPVAAAYPIALTVAPTERVPDLPSMSPEQRQGLAAMLVDVFTRLDGLYDTPLPYMMWLNQRPCDGGEWPHAWFSIEIVSPWRSKGVSRFIAAAEVACHEYFNPVIPEVLASQLRALTS